MNLAEAAIEVYREPDATKGEYREALASHRGELLTATVVAGIRVDVAALFPEP